MTTAEQQRQVARDVALAAHDVAVLAHQANPTPETTAAELAAGRALVAATHAVIADELIAMQRQEVRA